jgi:threonyl-tRNA synthetase
LRVRGFTQDDSHIFCEPAQIQTEISSVLDFIASTLHLFGFSFEVNLSTRPEKYAGTLERWDQAEAALKSALESRQQAYVVDEGGGVFYGPKIDIKLRDAMGREWQGPTIQVDFNLPERFDLNYIGEDGSKHQPVMIHRAIFGSIERFLGALIEQYGGAFPAWLAPVQVKLLPIADRHADGAQKIKEKLMAAGARVEVDDRREKIGLKIREAEMQKIPYMLVVGDKELAAGTVAVRGRGQKDLGVIPIDDFIARLQQDVISKQDS